MPAHPELDNPFWSSLASIHRDLALCSHNVARYPARYAPFLGVGDAQPDVSTDLETLIAPGESLLLLGIAPHVGGDLRLDVFRPLAQMVCELPIETIDGPEIIELGVAHRADVLALTALVYPHYFRERTMDMGRYFGIYEGNRLAAMIGERLGTESARELSAICTHPDYTGLGYARRLTAMLANDILRRGRLPFLHVSYENPRALHLYQRLGFRLRRDIPFWSLRRA